MMHDQMPTVDDITKIAATTRLTLFDEFKYYFYLSDEQLSALQVKVGDTVDYNLIRTLLGMTTCNRVINKSHQGCQEIYQRVLNLPSKKKCTYDELVSMVTTLVADIAECPYCWCPGRFKDIANMSLCWALPTKLSLDFVEKCMKDTMSTRIVDMGSGTGLWSYLLLARGLPVLAVDLPEDTRWPTSRTFVKPVTKYVQEPGDMLLVTWGSSGLVIDEFVANGGKAIVIQGEDEYGCTVSYTYPINRDWNFKSIGGIRAIPSMASETLEGICGYVKIES